MDLSRSVPTSLAIRRTMKWVQWLPTSDVCTDNVVPWDVRAYVGALSHQGGRDSAPQHCTVLYCTVLYDAVMVSCVDNLRTQ